MCLSKNANQTNILLKVPSFVFTLLTALIHWNECVFFLMIFSLQAALEVVTITISSTGCNACYGQFICKITILFFDRQVATYSKRHELLIWYDVILSFPYMAEITAYLSYAKPFLHKFLNCHQIFWPADSMWSQTQLFLYASFVRLSKSSLSSGWLL